MKEKSFCKGEKETSKEKERKYLQKESIGRSGKEGKYLWKDNIWSVEEIKNGV